MISGMLSDLDRVRSFADRRLGALESINQSLVEERKAFEEADSTQQRAKDARQFLLASGAKRRETGIQAFEQFATQTMQAMFSPDYRLMFEDFSDKRQKEGLSTYNLEMRVVNSGPRGDECIPLLNGKGGGLEESLATTLRHVALDWTGYDGPLLIDEPNTGVSYDEKQRANTYMLSRLAEQSSRQIIVVTHQVGVYAPIASKIIKFHGKNNRVANVEYVEPSQVADYILEEDDDGTND